MFHTIGCGGAHRGASAIRVRIAITVALLAIPAAVPAQEPAERDSLRHEVARLRARLDSLLLVVQRLEATRKATPADSGAQDPLAALRAAAAAAAGGKPDTVAAAGAAEAPAQPVGRARSLQALNPEITVTGDLLALVNADEPGEDNFIPREFELSLQSNLDPYSRAKVFIGRHVPGGELTPFEGEEEHEEGAIEIEEGYIEWVNLPHGLGLTFGRFRQKFGQLNRWHTHALPGQQLPLPYLAFFGEHGLVQTGASVHWLAPVYGLGTYEVWLEFARSGNEALFGESRGISTLGHLNAFYDLGRSTYFELGVSGMTGPGAAGDDGHDTRVAGVDFALSWRPPQQALYREAILRGGAVLGRVASPAALELPERAFGAFLIGEYKLNRRWTAGARYEYTEDPTDPGRHAWLAAPTLTWWQSEFVRIRAEFDYLQRPEGVLRQFLIQTTVSMGPHKHETY